ncbi:phosphotransferase [Halorubrum sp. GN11_10-6_MGM]|uniref:phosphotransferase family protein n=1 Tax=Halorubrum sp. GN11_10-6_MGM TaxID=2518112 RepID=UPI0010F964B1|nr:phosphotransferase [Halorubrum sp. GN11_10-6_MGM]TKX74631.1 phosphotransferase [Halorubrum sp. GN11_10-6_MGM]
MSDGVRDRALAETRPGATPVSVEPLGRGNRKETEAVRFETAAPVVVQRSETPAATRTEAALLAAIGARTDVPVPAPLGAGVVDGTGWLVTPLVEGRDLHEAFVGLDPTDRRGVARAFGRYLGEVHEAFRFAGCGRVAVDRAAPGDGGEADGARVDEAEADGAGVSGATSEEEANPASILGRAASLTVRDSLDAERWLRRFGERHVSRLPADFDDLREPLREALRNPVEGDAEPRLFPWDFRPGNALVAGGSVTAVLDWEAPLSAPRGVSVAKAEHLVADWYVSAAEAEPLREAFRAGYESVVPLPPVGRAHRAAAVASAVVDGEGVVTNPRFPPVGRDAAVAFHRKALERAVDGAVERE